MLGVIDRLEGNGASWLGRRAFATEPRRGAGGLERILAALAAHISPSLIVTILLLGFFGAAIPEPGVEPRRAILRGMSGLSRPDAAPFGVDCLDTLVAFGLPSRGVAEVPCFLLLPLPRLSLKPDRSTAGVGSVGGGGIALGAGGCC